MYSRETSPTPSSFSSRDDHHQILNAYNNQDPISPFDDAHRMPQNHDRDRDRDWSQRDHHQYYNPPHTPPTPDPNQPLLNSPSSLRSPPYQNAPFPTGNTTNGNNNNNNNNARRTPSATSSGFVSSPLNPTGGPTSSSQNSFSGYHPGSVGSLGSASASGSRSRVNSVHHLNRMPSEDTQALINAGSGARGSMILWKLAGDPQSAHSVGGGPIAHTNAHMMGVADLNAPLTPPERRFSRFSMHSNSDAASLMSYSDDSKYPSARPSSGFVAYAYDPLLDDQAGPKDEVDRLHEDGKKFLESRQGHRQYCNCRGMVNVVSLTLLVIGVVLLFTFYPIITFFRRNPIQTLITGNVQINATGQFPDLPNLPQLIDLETPEEAKTRQGWDGQEYELVFSDEFNQDNRTFFAGDDPFWEAVDLWYWATNDMEWYDPRQVTTRDGKLVITMDQLDPAVNHNLTYRSGMLQSWNKFCFTTGYIEVSLSLPGRNSDAQGYWPGAWIMGNLGRPGFGATTDGTWPYSYDTCDIGTFPNQSFPDHSGPPAALHTDQGRAKYNFELSWLSGQKFSKCTCPGEDHPGPNVAVGRGAPEIDILEAQKNKLGEGGKVSQSAQFAPFNADYQANYAGLTIYNSTYTARNSYNGSAVQQAITCLTTLPERVYKGTGGEFASFAFEWWSNPDNRDEGYISWQADSIETFTMQASTVGPDPVSQIGPRLIPEEPMSIVLNLGISTGFQNVDVSTLDFPAEFLIDYVRVYQRKGQTNIGCDPPQRPTAKYIQDHLVAYTNPNITNWASTGFQRPKNSAYSGGC